MQKIMQYARSYKKWVNVYYRCVAQDLQFRYELQGRLFIRNTRMETLSSNLQRTTPSILQSPFYYFPWHLVVPLSGGYWGLFTRVKAYHSAPSIAEDKKTWVPCTS
jgi:hypothetical protein